MQIIYEIPHNIARKSFHRDSAPVLDQTRLPFFAFDFTLDFGYSPTGK